jgi:hypothetical protein
MTSDAEKDDAIIQSVWNRQRQWSKAANELKSGIVKWRTSVLVLGSVGAVLQTLAATLPAAFVSSASAVVGTVALALVPALTGYYLTPEQTRKWLRARSVSEGLKSETFLFRAGAEPYCGADALGVFMEKTREIETWAGNLEPELARIQPDAKPPPGPLDPETYLVRRIQEQVDKYYRPQAALNAQRARWFHQAEILLGVAAAVLAAIATALHLPATGEAPGGLSAWVAVLTTIGASSSLHMPLPAATISKPAATMQRRGSSRTSETSGERRPSRRIHGHGRGSSAPWRRRSRPKTAGGWPSWTRRSNRIRPGGEAPCRADLR